MAKNHNRQNDNPESEPKPEVVIPEQEVVPVPEPEVIQEPVVIPEPTNGNSVKYSASNVVAIIKDDSITPEDKLILIAESGMNEFATVVNVLSSYNENINNINLSIDMLGKVQTDFFNSIKAFANTVDYSAFKIKMHIFQLGLDVYGKGSLNMFNLCRYDEQWNGTSNEHKAYLAFTQISTMLKDVGSRKDTLRKLDIPQIQNTLTLGMGVIASENIAKYYNF